MGNNLEKYEILLFPTSSERDPIAKPAKLCYDNWRLVTVPNKVNLSLTDAV